MLLSCPVQDEESGPRSQVFLSGWVAMEGGHAPQSARHSRCLLIIHLYGRMKEQSDILRCSCFMRLLTYSDLILVV
jgi:hypothetical protein